MLKHLFTIAATLLATPSFGQTYRGNASPYRPHTYEEEYFNRAVPPESMLQNNGPPYGETYAPVPYPRPRNAFEHLDNVLWYCFKGKQVDACAVTYKQICEGQPKEAMQKDNPNLFETCGRLHAILKADGR